MIDQFTERSDQGPVATVVPFTATGWPGGVSVTDFQITCGCDECDAWRVRVGLPRDIDSARRLMNAERARLRAHMNIAADPELETLLDEPLSRGEVPIGRVTFTPGANGLYDLTNEVTVPAQAYTQSGRRAFPHASYVEDRLALTEEDIRSFQRALDAIEENRRRIRAMALMDDASEEP